MRFAELPTTYRARAEQLAEYAPAAATAFREAARLAEDALVEHAMEALDLDEAAKESGYSTDHLRRLLREHTVPNAGTEGELRIRRGDLPRKPGYGIANARLQPAVSRMQVARAVVDQE